jgi:hypothetical protein
MVLLQGGIWQSFMHRSIFASSSSRAYIPLMRKIHYVKVKLMNPQLGYDGRSFYWAVAVQYFVK